MPSPQFLSIGHCCHDRLAGQNILGGTASYVALVARQLGLYPGILTSVGADFEFFDVFAENDIAVHNKPAPRTTVFENRYQNGRRLQYLHERALALSADDVPPEWLAAPIVLLCPIAWEVNFSLLRVFPKALTAATIQGWLRERDPQGRIHPRGMDWQQLVGLDAVILSDADIAGFEAALPEIAAAVEVVVMTLGARGAVVFRRGEKRHFPAFPVREVDATGAGDVFAAAFLTRYAERRDAASAAVFANCAASFIVEGVGVTSLPSLEQIQGRVEQWPHG